MVYLANGMQVGKTSQSLSTDVGDHVLVQGYIGGMHQISNTATPTILHHNPQGFTTTPAALPVTHLFKLLADEKLQLPPYEVQIAKTESQKGHGHDALQII